MSALIRDPAEWARESGWISRRKAENAASKLDDLAEAIEEGLDRDDDACLWAKELRRISKSLAPGRVVR